MAGIHPGRLGERVLRDRNQQGVPLLRAQPEGCWYAADNARPDEREPQKTVVVDRAYIDTHTPVVRDRLVKAGVRLGGLLNRALGASASTSEKPSGEVADEPVRQR